MTKIVCQHVLELKVDKLHEQIEVCDQSGRTLGRFVPEDVYATLSAALAKTEFTEEELDRAERQPGGRTTVEVLASLKDK